MLCRVLGVVQTAVAKSGKGAVQGAVRGAVKVAVQGAVLWFPRWEPSVPSFRNWKFFAMVTYGSQVGKYVEVSNGLHPLCSSSLLVENYSKTVGNSFKLTPTCNTRVW